MKRIKKVLMMAMVTMLLCGNTITVFADKTDSTSSYEVATDAERDRIRGELNRYYSDMKLMNDISQDALKKMDKIYNKYLSYQ